MDVARGEVEHLRLAAAREAALSELERARAECAAITATVCEPFASGDAGRVFVETAARVPASSVWSDEDARRRPDLAALEAALRAADQRARLARNQVIPDVTVRLGYVCDTFEVSGAQQRSLALGVQLPLPVAFDEGRATSVVAPLAGRVDSVVARLGQRVPQGARLSATCRTARSCC